MYLIILPAMAACLVGYYLDIVSRLEGIAICAVVMLVGIEWRLGEIH